MKRFLLIGIFFTLFYKGVSNTNDTMLLKYYLIKYKNIILVRSPGNCFTLLCFNNNLEMRILKGTPEDSTYNIDFTEIKALRIDTLMISKDVKYKKYFFDKLKKMSSKKYINKNNPQDSFRFEFFSSGKKVYDAFGIYALRLNDLFFGLRKKLSYDLNPVCNF